VHEHPFLKIRKPEHSPAMIHCQYSNQMSQQSNNLASSQASSSQPRKCNKKPQEKKAIH